MVGSKKLLVLAVAAALSARASAQAVSPEQALGQNQDAIRGHNQVQAGLDRAQRAPLEAVWLRAEVLEEMWQRHPTLSRALQGCDKAGTPRQGCAVSGRTFWRFTLAPTHNAFSPALSAQAFRASPPDKDTPPPAGGVYLVASPKAIGQRDGSVLLAAGATAQLIDTAYPSILIEVKAPEDQPLLLGSLAASDIGKALALLARLPGSAKVATVAEGGRITLQKTQVASIAPVQRVVAEPDFSGDFTTLVAAIELPTALVKRDAPRALEMDAGTVAALDVAPKRELKGDFTAVVAALEIPVTLAKRHAPMQELDTKAIAALDMAPKPELQGDFAPLAAAMEVPVALAKGDARMIDFDSNSIAALDLAPRREFNGDFSPVAAALEMPMALVAPKVEIAPKPLVIAAVAPKPINVVVDVAPAPSANADVARMRAEIEAEIARENARLAQNLQGRTTRRIGFGT